MERNTTEAAVLRALSILQEAAPARLATLTGRSRNGVAGALRRLEAQGRIRSRTTAHGKAWRLQGVDPAGFALPAASVRVLEAVERRPGSSVSELATEIGVSVSEVSRHAATLARDGWLHRAKVERTVRYVVALDG